MIVEWIGGPWDGQQAEIQNQVKELQKPVARRWLDTTELDNPDYVELRIPVINGRLLWNSRTEVPFA